MCTDDGREVLSFAISCAIEEGQTVTASGLHALCGTSDPEPDTFDFFGEIGVANRWLNHPLNDAGQGWVSACLFARVNANDVPIPISLRGKQANLTSDDDEKAAWNLEEGAFYGNYFETLAGHPDLPDWHACRGRDQAAGEIGGLIDRDCAEPDPANPGFTLCGFAYAGECGDFASDFACKKFNADGTFYNDCAASDIFDDDDGHHGHGHDDDHHGRGHDHHCKHHHDHDKVYKEVITVFDLGV